MLFPLFSPQDYLVRFPQLKVKVFECGILERQDEQSKDDEKKFGPEAPVSVDTVDVKAILDQIVDGPQDYENSKEAYNTQAGYSPLFCLGERRNPPLGPRFSLKFKLVLTQFTVMLVNTVVGFEPLEQATLVDMLEGTGTVAGRDDLLRARFTPTNPTHDLGDGGHGGVSVGQKGDLVYV